MIRKAFVMSVFPGHEETYAGRHNLVWPELAAELESHGAHNYSIFLHPETRQLFAYVEIESEERWAAIADTEACRRWWAHMRDLMPTHPDNRPVSVDLKPVFHLP